MLELRDRVRINQLDQKKFSHQIAAYGISEGVVEGLHDFIISVAFETTQGKIHRKDIQRMYLEKL
jgi:hypothetical protein